jgi:hypothetical protein
MFPNTNYMIQARAFVLECVDDGENTPKVYASFNRDDYTNLRYVSLHLTVSWSLLRFSTKYTLCELFCTVRKGTKVQMILYGLETFAVREDPSTALFS